MEPNPEHSQAPKILFSELPSLSSQLLTCLCIFSFLSYFLLNLTHMMVQFPFSGICTFQNNRTIYYFNLTLTLVEVPTKNNKNNIKWKNASF